MSDRINFGVNIDHVATVRNARGGTSPDPTAAARLVCEGGCDTITVHLREDRRHIKDEDVVNLRNNVDLPLNLEMAATDDMLRFALEQRPHSCCIVPEGREELTTESGLDVVNLRDTLVPKVLALKNAGILVSLFISPDSAAVTTAAELGAATIELNTGTYCNYNRDKMFVERDQELCRLKEAMELGARLGLKVHAGHGLDYGTVAVIASIPQLCGLHIGHFIVGEAIFVGLSAVTRRIRKVIDEARDAL